MLLIVEVVMWRDVKMVEVRDVISGLFARALVWGDVDPHCSGLCTREADGSTIVVEKCVPRRCWKAGRDGSGMSMRLK